MSACEKCWGDAYLRSMSSGRSQTEEYLLILEERKDNPCSAEEQAGDWWDKEKKIDRRLIK